MDGQTGKVTGGLVDRTVVRGIGTLALVGMVIFFIVGVPIIAVYLGLAGIAFWVFSLKWQRRYENVLDAAPEGYQPTGEVYSNPPASDGAKVAVYFKGIRRVYVRAQD